MLRTTFFLTTGFATGMLITRWSNKKFNADGKHHLKSFGIGMLVAIPAAVVWVTLMRWVWPE